MKKKTIIISSVILVFVAIISVVPFVVNKVEAPETSVSSTQETLKPTNTSTTTYSETESTTNETTTRVTITTTKKVSTTKAETTTKKVTTTKAETTTKKNTEGTFNGHKPYEVFVDPVSGNKVYYNESGRLCSAETLTTKPKEPSDKCPLCGKENCGAYIKPWHCVVCDKDIAADECHPLSHLKKSL